MAVLHPFWHTPHMNRGPAGVHPDPRRPGPRAPAPPVSARAPHGSGAAAGLDFTALQAAPWLDLTALQATPGLDLTDPGHRGGLDLTALGN